MVLRVGCACMHHCTEFAILTLCFEGDFTVGLGVAELQKQSVCEGEQVCISCREFAVLREDLTNVSGFLVFWRCPMCLQTSLFLTSAELYILQYTVLSQSICIFPTFSSVPLFYHDLITVIFFCPLYLLNNFKLLHWLSCGTKVSS